MKRTRAVLLGLGALAAMLASTASAGLRMAAMGPLTEMVICDHKDGASTILIDRAGQPVSPKRDCCDGPCAVCLGAVTAALLPTAAPLGLAAGGASRCLSAPQSVVAPRPEAVNRARGPPSGKV